MPSLLPHDLCPEWNASPSPGTGSVHAQSRYQCLLSHGQGGDDETHPGEELPEVMLDLGDHPPWPVPGGRLILEAPVADQRGMPRPAAWPGEQVLDGPL